MTKDDRETMHRLGQIGFSLEDANALRLIERTLHRWFEGECGINDGCIERDETTNKVHWLNATTGKRYPMQDRETGARKRLAKLMERYPDFVAYVQTDPRGGALWIVRKSALQPGEQLDCVYTRGIPV